MPEGNIPPWRFRNHAAEEVLYMREKHNSRQDPDRVARWRRSSPSGSQDVPSEDGSDVMIASEHATEDGLDCGALPELEVFEEEIPRSMPLQALPAPSPVSGSPFATVLGFMRKEPYAMQVKRDAALRRQVQKMLRQIYRRSVEASGSVFRSDPPWPPKERKHEDLLPQIRKVSPLKVMPRSTKSSKKISLEEVMQVESNAKERSSMTNPERQAMIRSMTAFGRGSQGGPYTLRQVYEEVEADVHHRRPVDVRASLGRLGPELLGPGAMRTRRKLPFAHPQMLERSRSVGSLMLGTA
mmetsp:Transcript_59939/g.73422  ORF Transcript_59939/g.73422 Transcript_59939/m.73422 type:complete len:297 (+) Transcript_59939:83-973(+)